MGCCEPKHMMRPLIVGDKMVVVGLTGKSVVRKVDMQPSKTNANARKNGKITRMGLLEHSLLGAPFNHHQRDPKPHLAREFLWENDAHEQLRGRRIWELQSLHLSIPGEKWLDQPLINTMIPFQALFWGTSEEELQKLCRLSWHIAIEREGRRYEKWSLREVKAQYTQPGPESRCLKLEGDKGEDHDAVCFEIDGAGGERVTGVEAKGTSTLKVGQHASQLEEKADRLPSYTLTATVRFSGEMTMLEIGQRLRCQQGTRLWVLPYNSAENGAL